MSPNVVPYVAVLLAGMVVGCIVTSLVWTHRRAPGGLAFAVLSGGAAWWCLWNAVDLAAPDLGTKIFSAQLWYIAAAGLPAAFLVFALQYSRRESAWPAGRLAPFGIAPLCTCLMVWTNPLHHQFWATTYLRTDGPFPMFGVTHGPLFWVAVLASYVQLAAGAVILIRGVIDQAGMYRRQAALVVAGVAVPWLANGVYTAGLSPFPDLDLTPLSFVLAASLMGWAVFGQRLLDVLPVAHHLVIEGLAEPVFVLDREGRLVYRNGAAQRWAGWQDERGLGRPLAAALPELAAALPDDGQRSELERGVGAARRLFEVTASALPGQREDHGGHVILLRDVTDRGLIDDLQLSRRQIIGAEEEVRRQMGELLHGPIQTKLLAAWHELGQAAAGLGPDDAQLASTLDHVRQGLDELREQDVRHVSHLLHPSIIRVGLAPAVDYLAGGFEAFFEVDVHADSEMHVRDPLDEGLRLTAYRLIEEALGNAAKHSGASHVEVSIRLSGGELHVGVADNGRGFDPVRVAQGLGFRSMTERIASASGSWRVRSEPGQGTRIDIELPLEVPELAAAGLSPRG